MKLSINAIVVLALAIPLILGILARFTPEGEFLEGGRDIEEGAFRRTMLYIYLGIGIPILLVIFISKMKKYFKPSNEYHNRILEPVVVKQGRLNKFDDPWGIYVYSYDPHTIPKEYNEPHFTVKVNEKKICSYHIPTIQEWVNRKELRLLHGRGAIRQRKVEYYKMAL